MFQQNSKELIYKLGASLMEDDILITGVNTDTFIVVTPRKGRTDNEIDTTMRNAKVKLMVVYKEVTGESKNIKIRYKVVTQEEYSKIASKLICMLQ